MEKMHTFATWLPGLNLVVDFSQEAQLVVDWKYFGSSSTSRSDSHPSHQVGFVIFVLRSKTNGMLQRR